MICPRKGSMSITYTYYRFNPLPTTSTCFWLFFYILCLTPQPHVSALFWLSSEVPWLPAEDVKTSTRTWEMSGPQTTTKQTQLWTKTSHQVYRVLLGCSQVVASPLAAGAPSSGQWHDQSQSLCHSSGSSWSRPAMQQRCPPAVEGLRPNFLKHGIVFEKQELVCKTCSVWWLRVAWTRVLQKCLLSFSSQGKIKSNSNQGQI